MIGRPEWFQRRKYGGWGLSPKTWQGWVYILIFIIPFAVFQSLPLWDNNTRIFVTLAWISVLLIDVIDIMARLKKDEREKIHEAIAERNAAWSMVAVATIGILYSTISAAIEKRVPTVDPFLAGVLIVGVLAKMISNIYLDKKD